MNNLMLFFVSLFFATSSLNAMNNNNKRLNDDDEQNENDENNKKIKATHETDKEIDKKVPKYNSIHEAIQHGCLESLTYWINQGHTNTRSNSGKTALIIAVSGNQVECLKLLIKAQAELNLKPTEDTLDDYNTALINAVDYDYLECLKLLIEAGADLNLQNDNGNTALMIAAESNKIDALKLLINAGADINFQKKYGATALMKAALHNHVKSVELLLNAGSDLTLQCQKKTALEWAQSKKSILNWLATIIFMNDEKKVTYLCQTNKNFQEQAYTLMLALKIKIKESNAFKISKYLRFHILLLIWHLQNPNDYRIKLWWHNGIVAHLQDFQQNLEIIENQELKTFIEDYIKKYNDNK